MTSMRNISHHPKPATLAALAAGGLDEARRAVVAAHVAACDACRAAVADFEAVGGACLEVAEPVAMKAGALADFWARAGMQDPLVQPLAPVANDIAIEATAALRPYLKGDLDKLAWRAVAPGLSQHVIEAEGYRRGVLRLLKISPGVRIPTHSHGDEELTLILRGSYRDEIGDFSVGDLADLGDETEHAPRATGDEPCICLIATNAPLVFRDFVGKVMQPFVGL